MLADAKRKAIYSFQWGWYNQCCPQLTLIFAFFIWRNKPKFKKRQISVSRNFSAQHNIRDFNFAQSFLKHCRHQTCDIQSPVGTKLQMFYPNLLISNSQILISVRIANRRIAHPLFTRLPWLIAYYDITLFWSREELFTSPITNQQIRSN